MIAVLSEVLPPGAASDWMGKFWLPNILRPSTTTVEAPFSSALQPKLPLWKYLMARNGKTLFITVQPSGMKVHNCMMLKPSSTGEVHAYPAAHPEINKGFYIFLCLKVFLFWWRQHPAVCVQTWSQKAFPSLVYGAVFASSGELGYIYNTWDQFITQNLFSWPLCCFLQSLH